MSHRVLFASSSRLFCPASSTGAGIQLVWVRAFVGLLPCIRTGQFSSERHGTLAVLLICLVMTLLHDPRHAPGEFGIQPLVSVPCAPRTANSLHSL